MSPPPSPSRAPTPYGVRIRDILLGRTQGWWQHDLLALTGLFYAQRLLELAQRRPDAKWRAPAGALRNIIAGGATLLPGEAAPWADALAADIGADPRFGANAEARLRDWLAARPSPRAGKGLVMVIPTLGAGGAEGQMARLALSLVAEGVPLTVLVKHAGAPAYDFHRPALEHAGVAVKTLSEFFDADQPADLPPLDPDLHRSTRALVSALEALRPAAVHAWMDEMGAASGLASAAAGVPRVVIDGRNLSPLWFETRGLGSIRAAFRALEGRAHFVNNSEAGADDYRAWLDRADLPIEIVRNGLETIGLEEDAPASAALRAQFAPGGGRLVGGMMRFMPEKRPLLWIDAAAAYARRRPDARFVLWGEGALRPAMERRARRAGLADRLAMPGLTRDRSVALGAIDALLLASIAEGTPNVALEAQFLGTPVAASAAGGVRETIVPALRDLVVDVPDPETLADALERAESRDRETTKAAARSWVLETFSPDAQRRAYRRLYGL